VQTDTRDLIITDHTRAPDHRYNNPELDAYQGTVSFIVDGRLYTIHRNSLMAYPDTTLAKFAEVRSRGDFAGKDDQPIPFDADPDIFKSVLNFYRYGTLKRPFGVPQKTFLLAVREFGLERFLDGQSMEEFDEVTRQIEEAENAGQHVKQLVYSFSNTQVIHDYSLRVLSFCVNVQFETTEYPSLPPLQSENLKRVLIDSCVDGLSVRSSDLTCCYQMKGFGAIPQSSMYFVGQEIERLVPGLIFNRHAVYPHPVEHNTYNKWICEAEFIFDVELSN
jgi:hypothetical protein